MLAPAVIEVQCIRAPWLGLAAQLRDFLVVSSLDREDLGLSGRVGILASGGFRIRRTRRESGFLEAGKPLESWPIELLPTAEGGRVVDPIRPSHDQSVRAPKWSSRHSSTRFVGSESRGVRMRAGGTAWPHSTVLCQAPAGAAPVESSSPGIALPTTGRAGFACPPGPSTPSETACDASVGCPRGCGEDEPVRSIDRRRVNLEAPARYKPAELRLRPMSSRIEEIVALW